MSGDRFGIDGPNFIPARPVSYKRAIAELILASCKLVPGLRDSYRRAFVRRRNRMMKIRNLKRCPKWVRTEIRRTM